MIFYWLNQNKKGQSMKESIILLNFACSIVCAKWALDLEYSQFRQIIWGLGGMLFGPFIMLLLYIRFIYLAKSEGSSSGNII
jgi:hypothetical protein